MVDYRWQAAKTIYLIQKFNLCPTMGDRGFLDITSKYLLVMELGFDVIVHSKLGDEDSDAGHIKCSLGPHLARGLQVPHTCPKQSHCVRCLTLRLLSNSLCGPRTKKFGDPWTALYSASRKQSAKIDFSNWKISHQKLHSMFWNTYVCNSIFSGMKQVKSKNRNRIADETVDDSLHLLPLTLVLIKER